MRKKTFFRSSFLTPQLQNLAGTPLGWIHKALNSDRVPISLKFLNSRITIILKFINYLDPCQVNPFFIFPSIGYSTTWNKKSLPIFANIVHALLFFIGINIFVLLSSAVNGFYLGIFLDFKNVLTSMISPKFWINHWQLGNLDIL